MKVFVTGANGFIGSKVVERLLDDDVIVIAAAHHFNCVDPRAERFSGEIFDPQITLPSADALLHLAWHNGFVHNHPSHLAELSDHFRFLCRALDSGIGRIAVMGSMHEVGSFEGKVDENTPTNPSTLYGIAKNALRQSLLVQQKTSYFTLQWLRGFYITGDEQRNLSVFTKILRAAEQGMSTFPLNSGKNRYDFIDINELAEQICAVVQQDATQGIINVCSGTPVSLRDKVNQFISENELTIQAEYGAFPDRPQDSTLIYGDNRIIQAVIKEKPIKA